MNEKETQIPELEDLKKFKKESGWTYQRISNLMGVHSQTVVFWITGTYKPSKMAKEKIKKFLEEYSYK